MARVLLNSPPFKQLKCLTMTVSEMIQQHYPECYTIESYPAAQTICIRKVKDEWGILGNFAQAPILVDGVTFDCTERLFHMMKLSSDAVEGIHDMMNIAGGMRMKMHMKRMYKDHPEWFHDHWPSMVVDAMKYCLVKKYEQCEAFRNELERSKGKYIVEDETARKRGRDADSWGTVLRGGAYVGPNLLGRLLMELRDNGTLSYTLPDNALAFVKVCQSARK